MKKKCVQMMSLMMAAGLFLAACSGAGSGAPTTASSQEAASLESTDTRDNRADAEGETPYGFPLSFIQYEISLSEETYDALGTLNNAHVAAGKKTGETDEDGNEIIRYQIISYDGEVKESPAFTGYLSNLGYGGFSIQVEEGGERYDILYDYDGTEAYSSLDNERGYREIVSWSDGDIVQLVKYRDADEYGNVYVDCDYVKVGEADSHIQAHDFFAFQMSPMRQGRIIFSAFDGIGDGEPGWLNYADVDIYNPERSTFHSIHLEDANWVYSYPYAPLSFGDNRNLILVRKFTEEADENGGRQGQEIGLYSMESGEFIPLPEPFYNIHTWTVDSILHPVSLSGLVMLCESEGENTRHALYSVPLRQKLIDYEDGYGSIALDDFDNSEGDLAMLLVSDQERNQWTWLVGTVVNEQTESGYYQRYISELEPFGIWFDDACSFRDDIAFFKADDGMCYGLMDTHAEGDDRFQICTEPFEAEGVFALAYHTYGVKEGDHYRILRLER